MKIVFIDGMGGGLAAQIISQLHGKLPEGSELLGVGTNALATAAMLKAGVSRGATGENAICVTAASADVIVGPIGIMIPHAMMGEVTPRMAAAVSLSPAKKLLVPVKQEHFEFIGMEIPRLSELTRRTAARLLELCKP